MSSIEIFNKAVSDAINKRDETYTALIGNEDFVPEPVIETSSDFNCGALCNEVEFLKSFSTYYVQSFDVDIAEDENLDILINTVMDLPRRNRGEPDVIYRQRYRAIVVQQNTIRRTTKTAIINALRHILGADAQIKISEPFESRNLYFQVQIVGSASASNFKIFMGNEEQAYLDQNFVGGAGIGGVVAYVEETIRRVKAAGVDFDFVITTQNTFEKLVDSTIVLRVQSSKTSNTSVAFIRWTQRQTFPNGQGVTALTFGNGLYIAGVTAAGPRPIWTSPDGITWTERQELGGAPILSLAFGNNIFVAGVQDAIDSIWTSSDGITWTSRGNLGFSNPNTLTFGNGIFVAGTANSRVWTSPDGITWTERQTLDGGVTASVFGNGLYLVGAGNTVNPTIWTSTDGITWTLRQSLDGLIAGIVFGNGIYVVGTSLGFGGEGESIWTSPDGITWTEQYQASTGIRSLTFGNGIFAAGLNNGVLAGTDGINWTPQFGPAVNVEVIFGDLQFVAGALDTTWTGQ